MQSQRSQICKAKHVNSHLWVYLRRYDNFSILHNRSYHKTRPELPVSLSLRWVAPFPNGSQEYRSA
jgi:hypothetical protein